MRNGFTLKEGLVAGGLVLVLAVPMLLGVLDTRRRSRDAGRVSSVRQAQAALETHRARYASYPAEAHDLPPADAVLVGMFAYEALPLGCAVEKAEICADYALHFELEGSLGGLVGKTCTAGPRGLSCAP